MLKNFEFSLGIERKKARKASFFCLFWTVLIIVIFCNTIFLTLYDHYSLSSWNSAFFSRTTFCNNYKSFTFGFTG